jgi:redox-sensing transcriptional repressor
MSDSGSDREVPRALPEATVARLHRYRRLLDEISAEGVETVSSEDLARAGGINPAQVRKDLSWVGSFGTRGVGYATAELRTHLTEVLGLDREWRVAIVGAGNLGRALAHYRGFATSGFAVVAVFDTAPEVVGTEVAGVRVTHVDDLEEIVVEHDVDVAIIAVPASEADEVARRLAGAGVTGLLNFAPAHLVVDARVRRVDLSTELGVLAYYEHLDRPVPSGETPSGVPLDTGAATRHASPTVDRPTTG